MGKERPVPILSMNLVANSWSGSRVADAPRKETPSAAATEILMPTTAWLNAPVMYGVLALVNRNVNVPLMAILFVVTMASPTPTVAWQNVLIQNGRSAIVMIAFALLMAQWFAELTASAMTIAARRNAPDKPGLPALAKLKIKPRFQCNSAPVLNPLLLR